VEEFTIVLLAPNGLKLSDARMGSLTAKFYAPGGTRFCCGTYPDSAGS
jgi:hypothetical protein